MLSANLSLDPLLPRSASMRSRLVRLVVLVLAIGFAAAGGAPASSPPAGSVTVPTTAGGTASDSWTGTIPPGSNPASNCTSGLDPADHHLIQINAPASYGTLSVQFVF